VTAFAPKLTRTAGPAVAPKATGYSPPRTSHGHAPPPRDSPPDRGTQPAGICRNSGFAEAVSVVLPPTEPTWRENADHRSRRGGATAASGCATTRARSGTAAAVTPVDDAARPEAGEPTAICALNADDVTTTTTVISLDIARGGRRLLSVPGVNHFKLDTAHLLSASHVKTRGNNAIAIAAAHVVSQSIHSHPLDGLTMTLQRAVVNRRQMNTGRRKKGRT